MSRTKRNTRPYWSPGLSTYQGLFPEYKEERPRNAKVNGRDGATKGRASKTPEVVCDGETTKFGWHDYNSVGKKSARIAKKAVRSALKAALRKEI